MPSTKKYISQVITKQEIDKWKWGDKILISSGTGTGKTTFIRNQIYDKCKPKNKKILILSNRISLKEQIKKDTQEKSDLIYVQTYQSFSNCNFDEIESRLSHFGVVVFDEAHFLFSDSGFNRKTDTLLNFILQIPTNQIKIFLTATPYSLINSKIIHFDYTYNIERDFSFIDELSFYTKEDIPLAICQNASEYGKVLYFSNDALNAYNLANQFLDAAFICSPNNKIYKLSKNKIDKTLNTIIKEKAFEERILCSTKVLENGVDLIDENLRTIIIHGISDPITIIQMLGRKRIINSDDKIKLYIKDFSKHQISLYLQSIQSELKIAEELIQLGETKFKEKYKKQLLPTIIDTDLTINIAKQKALEFQKVRYQIMLNYKDGFREFCWRMLHYDQTKIKSANNEFEKRGIVALLEEYEGKPLYKEEQSEFRSRFIQSLFSPRKEIRNFGLNSINAILEENNVPFIITSRKNTKMKSEHRGLRYWIVGKVIDDV